jgi:hypothetical protein
MLLFKGNLRDPHQWRARAALWAPRVNNIHKDTGSDVTENIYAKDENSVFHRTDGVYLQYYVHWTKH